MAASELLPLGIRVFCDSLINKCRRIIGGGVKTFVDLEFLGIQPLSRNECACVKEKDFEGACLVDLRHFVLILLP